MFITDKKINEVLADLRKYTQGRDYEGATEVLTSLLYDCESIINTLQNEIVILQENLEYERSLSNDW